jgi:hypothetical protein
MKMGRRGFRLIHVIAKCGRGAVLLPVVCGVAVWAAVAPAGAINWEGKEGFFHEEIPLNELTEGVPKPIEKKKPTCAEMSEKRKENPYEQVPIEGVNCVGEG